MISVEYVDSSTRKQKLAHCDSFHLQLCGFNGREPGQSLQTYLGCTVGKVCLGGTMSRVCMKPRVGYA